jgi:nucleotide-binding universal stress UspA family protein
LRNYATRKHMRKAMKILLAVDGSEASLAAVEEIARTPWPEGSAVRIVSVAEVPFSDQQWAAPMQSGYYDEWERSGFLMYTTQAMTRFAEIAGARIKVTAKTLMGDPKIAILNEAEHWGADLTIYGSEFSDAAVEEIADRPAAGSVVHVISVIQSSVTPSPET